MDPYRLGLVAIRIHYFQLVARLGSMRQAAQMLNVAPSSVSRIIKQLEEELGLPLFERVRQRLKLTSAGELMLYHARQSFSELDRACNEINELHGLHRGTVSVAIIESVSRGLMPEALEAFWRSHPGIAVDVRVMSSQQVANAVAEGECDLGLVFDIRVPRNVRRIGMVSLPLGVVTRPNHRLAGKADLRMSDLAGERVILSDASLTLGAWVEEAFGRTFAELNQRARTNSIALMTDLAKRDLGLVLQTRVGIEQDIAESTLGFVPLRDPKLSLRKLMLLSRTEKEMSPASSALGRVLGGHLDRLRDATGEAG
ncbi:LysR family transcriptional regulator [Rhizobium sp. 9140]|uniref:LysR family transcriptional regulator n=1 Tax=Rhizobium sp. 9140 TaxID=1761900 RepID=UPI000792F1B0|nr:LysR family transcriptional regulator [Rhizobium sp. 9140]CZT37474.1 DNA-binding transcriptional regulator, LysR family [Rhizobium sp. 9140]